MTHRTLHYIFTIGFLFSFNVALTAYINSSFIEGVLGARYVGILFVSGAILSILLLEVMPYVVEKLGNEAALFISLALALIGITLLFTGGTLPAVGFVIYTAANTAVFFTLDIFLRHFVEKESMGRLRGLYLTLTNLAWVLSPFLAGTLAEKKGFLFIYLISFIAIATVAISSLFALKHFKDAKYYTSSIVASIIQAFRRDDIRDILTAQFLLQLFFSIMVIFTPLYLIDVKGYDFGAIGIMFTIMLLPFVILQYPLGKLADQRLGEKELLIIGFLIMSVSTLSFALYKGHEFIAFALLLLATRIGASTVEVMTETYFFKTVTVEEPELVSTFKGMAPLAHIVGPLIAGILIPVVGFTPVFIGLSIVLLGGIRLAYLIHDTK